MNVALRRPMTLAEFLAWEDRQELRYEFDGFQAIAMTGGTIAHSSIQRNILIALGNRLRGKPCQPHGSHLKIEVVGRIRYPDAFVVCTPLPRLDKVVRDPVVVFEVLSESSIGVDLQEKNLEYRATPSIQRYVIVQQDRPGALVFYRRGEDWLSDPISGDGAVLTMPEIGIEVPLAEFYIDLELTPPTDE